MPRGLLASCACAQDGVPDSSWRALLFQDVDGVLNHNAGGERLDPELLRQLGDVVRTSDAGIVISSAWRKYPRAMKEELIPRLHHDAGIPLERILGTTPSLCPGVECRAKEIETWFHEHPGVLAPHGKWVAIDDRDLEAQNPAFMKGHFVRTAAVDGLTASKAQEAKRLLGTAVGSSDIACSQDHGLPLVRWMTASFL